LAGKLLCQDRNAAYNFRSMKKWLGALRPGGIILLVPLLLVAGASVARVVARPKTMVAVSDLTPLSLDGVQRILILAPHCDDETLGSGGLIQSALAAGIQIRVVIATNGDGYMFATAEEFHKLYPTAQDYVRMGEVRQRESLAALAALGLAPQNVFFLSYPDRGTPWLWEKNWSAANPYTSPHSGANRSPYPVTYDPHAVYAGEDYLADLISIIEAYRPDLVIYPHPDDVHPDHWGLSVFTRLALTEVSHRNPGYQLQQLTYLLHRPDFPVVRGLKPTASLVPPPELYAIYKVWLRWDLAPDQVTVKGQAVQAYKSQLPLLHGLMDSFVRANELFGPVTSANLPTAAAGDPLDPVTWQDASGESIPPVQLDPQRDVLSHKTIPATDLTATYAARTPAGELWLCGQLSEAAAAGLPYSLRLKTLTETGIDSFVAHTKPKAGEAKVTRSGVYFCAQTSLANLGDPWAIMLGATVESPEANYPFDQTAWQMIYVQP
jgi:LmbE family N-acetylglucosaminyl deacetylase